MIISAAVFQIAMRDLERSNTGHTAPFPILVTLPPQPAAEIARKKPCAGWRFPCYLLSLVSTPQSPDQDHPCFCHSRASVTPVLGSISSVYWLPACAEMTSVGGSGRQLRAETRAGRRAIVHPVSLIGSACGTVRRAICAHGTSDRRCHQGAIGECGASSRVRRHRFGQHGVKRFLLA